LVVQLAVEYTLKYHLKSSPAELTFVTLSNSACNWRANF